MAKPKAKTRGARKPKNGTGGGTHHAAADEHLKQGPSDRDLRDFYERAVELFDEHKGAQEKARSINAKYRGVLKDAKKAGIEPSDIIWRITERGRDPADIDAETQRRNRLARVTKLPIGTQLGIFDDGETVATRVERDSGIATSPAERTKLQKEARAAGREAGKGGKFRTTNPWPLKSLAFNEWDAGWVEGQTELAGELGPAGKAGQRAAAAALN